MLYAAKNTSLLLSETDALAILADVVYIQQLKITHYKIW